MMEISKGLRKEIILVQNNLKDAIRDHQICVGKLKDDPNNADILAQIQDIQLHIVSLGRCQKQVVQRLRKEVEVFKAENANGAKLSVASLLGLNNNNNNNNNNNHITPDNEQRDEVVQVKVQINGISDSRRSSKDDYEEVVHNGDVSVTRDIRAKERSASVETVSIDEDIIELSNDESSCEKQDDIEEVDSRGCSLFEECKTDSKQTKFLDKLGLITVSKFDKLQNKKAERKRRSTANPHFVYSNWDIPTKKKKHSYLQTLGNGPQTRQTTRLNGPSPPPNKYTSKSTSPPVKTTSKSLIPVQKLTAKPTVGIQESRIISNKTQAENEVNQTSISNSKSLESKAVHIPGLPPGLIVEKVEKIEKTENFEKIETETVCIHCRKPGNLTICNVCSSSYHILCHPTSSPPSRLCPPCAQKKPNEVEEDKPIAIIKKSEELQEKERERYEQRERNADLRLQVYELEKRSQLLGQSIQLQHRLRQELLGKQEKTQKLIKRLVDFIKLMQLRPSSTLASTSSHPQPTSSPLHPIQLPQQPLLLHQNKPSSLPPSLSPTSSSTPSTIPSPIHLSSSTNSPLNPVSPPIFNQIPDSLSITQSQLSIHNQKNSNISSSKRFPIPALVESSVSLPSSQFNRLSPTNYHQLPKDLMSLNQEEKDKPTSSGIHLHSFTTNFQAVSLSQPFEATGSPPSAKFPDSIASHPSKSQTAPSVSWNHQIFQHRLMNENDKSVMLKQELNRQKFNASSTIISNQQPSWKLPSSSRSPPLVNQRQVYSTHCSQAIKSPISSPAVLMDHSTKFSLISNADPSQIDSSENSLKTSRACERDSPPPNSPNT